MKKIMSVALFSVFAIVSVSAQSKADNFSGNWKMISRKSNVKQSTTPDITLTVTKSGNKVILQKVETGITTLTETNEFKIEGDSLTYFYSGLSQPSLARIEARFLNENKLQILSFNNRYLDDIREIWKLSKDGKTLTIEKTTTAQSANSADFGYTVARSRFTKMIFVKQ